MNECLAGTYVPGSRGVFQWLASSSKCHSRQPDSQTQGWEFIKEKRKHARKHARKQEKIQVVLIGRIDKLLKVVESKID